MSAIDIGSLRQRQSLPLEAKINLTRVRLRQWQEHYGGDVYLAFSGGKDSTVLLDIIRSSAGLDDIPAVFVDTGLEYPEVREFAIARADEIIRPELSFLEVIRRYGYPVISKEQAQFIYEARHTKSDKLRNLRINGKGDGTCYGRISPRWQFLVDAPFEISAQCCHYLKRKPAHIYQRKTGRKGITAVMACESQRREKNYMQHGCNAYDLREPRSTPLAFWTEQDILHYIVERGVEIASVYGEIASDDLFGDHLTTTGCARTGCMFCMFGVHLEKPNRFQLMRKTHPKQYRYCMDVLGIGEVLDYIGVPKE